MKTITTLALLTIATTANAQHREDMHTFVLSRMDSMQEDVQRIDDKDINLELKKAEWDRTIITRAEQLKDLWAEFEFEIVGVVDYDKDPQFSRIFVKPLFVEEVDAEGYFYNEIPIQNSELVRKELDSAYPVNFYRKLSRREERLCKPGNVLKIAGRVTYRHQGIKDVDKTMTLDRQVSEHAYIGGWVYNVRQLSGKVMAIYIKAPRVMFEDK